MACFYAHPKLEQLIDGGNLVPPQGWQRILAPFDLPHFIVHKMRQSSAGVSFLREIANLNTQQITQLLLTLRGEVAASINPLIYPQIAAALALKPEQGLGWARLLLTQPYMEKEQILLGVALLRAIYPEPLVYWQQLWQIQQQRQPDQNSALLTDQLVDCLIDQNFDWTRGAATEVYQLLWQEIITGNAQKRAYWLKSLAEADEDKWQPEIIARVYPAELLLKDFNQRLISLQHIFYLLPWLPEPEYQTVRQALAEATTGLESYLSAPAGTSYPTFAFLQDQLVLQWLMADRKKIQTSLNLVQVLRTGNLEGYQPFDIFALAINSPGSAGGGTHLTINSIVNLLPVDWRESLLPPFLQYHATFDSELLYSLLPALSVTQITKNATTLSNILRNQPDAHESDLPLAIKGQNVALLLAQRCFENQSDTIGNQFLQQALQHYLNSCFESEDADTDHNNINCLKILRQKPLSMNQPACQKALQQEYQKFKTENSGIPTSAERFAILYFLNLAFQTGDQVLVTNIYRDMAEQGFFGKNKTGADWLQFELCLPPTTLPDQQGHWQNLLTIVQEQATQKEINNTVFYQTFFKNLNYNASYIPELTRRILNDFLWQHKKYYRKRMPHEIDESILALKVDSELNRALAEDWLKNKVDWRNDFALKYIKNLNLLAWQEKNKNKSKRV